MGASSFPIDRSGLVTMIRFLKRLARCNDAATSVEYAVMLGLILMVVIGSVIVLGNNTKNSWLNTSNSISSAASS